MLLVNGWIKYTDLDNYKQGCIKSLGGCCGHDSFSASNIIDLLDKLKDFCGHDDVLLNSCEEIGRIDIQGLENKDGY